MASLPRILAILLGLSLAIGSVWIYPSGLAFFSRSAGDPQNGPTHLPRSAIDWKLGLPQLEEFLESHPEFGAVAIASSGPIHPEWIGTQVGILDWHRRPTPLAGFSHVAIGGATLTGAEETRGTFLKPPPFADEFVRFYRTQAPIINFDGGWFAERTRSCSLMRYHFTIT